MADPLIGKFFSSWEQAKDGPPRRVIQRNGQVRSRVKEGLYLVKLMNAVPLVLAGIIEFSKQVMVPLDDMKDWEFFDSRDEWAEGYAAFARQEDAIARRGAR